MSAHEPNAEGRTGALAGAKRLCLQCFEIENCEHLIDSDLKERIWNATMVRRRRDAEVTPHGLRVEQSLRNQIHQRGMSREEWSRQLLGEKRDLYPFEVTLPQGTFNPPRPPDFYKAFPEIDFFYVKIDEVSIWRFETERDKETFLNWMV